MIQLRQLSLQRGPQFLLESVDLVIHRSQKVGVVGANGAGKSSLFQLLLKQLHPDQGDLEMPGDLRIAHMAQEVEPLPRAAVDYVMDGDQQLRALEAQQASAEAEGRHELLGELHAQLEAIGGYGARSRAEQLLQGLGFAQQDLSRPVRDFSGGWRIRLNLAQALMCPSDLLLLDEPTNHLDLDATLWLEQWLRQYPGTLMLISHDRDFLDRVASHIAHFEHKQIRLYKGNYSAFERLRAERLAQQQAMYQRQQQRVAEIEQFVRRFRAKATKAKQAQSRLKELERMELIAPAHVDSPFSFKFPASDKTSTPLLTLSDAALGYQGQALLADVNLTLCPGQRLGLLGPNGAGKSTLIKTLVGEQGLVAGLRVAGEHLRVGYFAQHQLEALDLEASPLLHLQRLSATTSEQELRDFLGAFGFHGDRGLEAVKRFSGGEKARLALAIIAWQRPNLLLMDEPTNHLDLEVRHALTLALQQFSGTLILVSHDRHLLRHSVDEFLLVADGQVRGFDGDLEDYHAWLLERNQRQRGARAQEMSGEAVGERAVDRRERKRLEAERRAQLRPLRQRVSELEAQMESLSGRLAELEVALADSAMYEEASREQMLALLQEQGQLTATLEEVEAHWLQCSEELEEMLAQS